MLAERLREARPGLYASLDLHHQAREAGVLVPARDDLERLQQRHASLEHGCELAGEKGDVLLVDAAPATKTLSPEFSDADPLAPQIGVDDCFGGRLRFAANVAVVAVDSFPQE